MGDNGRRLDIEASLYLRYGEVVVDGGHAMKPSETRGITRNSLARQLDDQYSTQYVQDAMDYFLRPLAVWTTLTQSSTLIRVSRAGTST
jgi:hypothetical protein